jgi:hypothetical protein
VRGATLLERGTVGDTEHEHVVSSIAISLKRIADVLTGEADGAALQSLVTNLAWEAGRSFQAGTRTDR